MRASTRSHKPSPLPCKTHRRPGTLGRTDRRNPERKRDRTHRQRPRRPRARRQPDPPAPCVPRCPVRTPLVLQLDVADREKFTQEWFGPISRSRPTRPRSRSPGKSRPNMRADLSVYSTDDAIVDAAHDAAVRGGVALSINLTGGVFVNQLPRSRISTARARIRQRGVGRPGVRRQPVPRSAVSMLRRKQHGGSRPTGITRMADVQTPPPTMNESATRRRSLLIDTPMTDAYICDAIRTPIGCWRRPERCPRRRPRCGAARRSSSATVTSTGRRSTT